MSGPASRRDDLASLISDMESDVRDLVRWGQAVRTMGCSNGSVESGSLFVVGDAMVEVAVKVESDWERCFELSRPLREGAR